MQHRPLQDEQDIEEILRIAVRNDTGGGDLRQRLESIAQEAGISEEALQLAEQEWHQERENRQKELARVEWQKQRRLVRRSQAWSHVWGVMIPIGLCTIFDWLPDRSLGWSLFVSAPLGLIAVVEGVGELLKPLDEKRFEKWYKKTQGRSQ